MGVAAYNRGSAAIAKQIAEDFERSSGSARKERISRIVRAEQRIEELEQFCRDAQAAYVNLQDEETAKGFALYAAHNNWLKKRDTKAFRKLHDECIESHCAWVDSDRIETFSHLQACHRKACAWKAVLDKLNLFYKWNFSVPRHL